MLKTFQIFRGGAQKSGNGITVNISAAELQKMAERYNQNGGTAPLLIGHPPVTEQAAAPKYGMVKRLFTDGLKLMAQAEVLPDFAALVRAGRYKHVSASLWPPGHWGNPTPDAWGLNHVGFVPIPAVKGMDALDFGEDGTLHCCTALAAPTADFSEAFKAACSPASLALHQAAVQHQQQHPSTSYEQAVRACLAQHPDY
ncbi:hypothetical protein [Paralysiella testudinis]|uniref:Uncharacterized protein n=1 Tax=Paralysiella testudinis TaxID=2809020 RepID=A0A892ZFW8_9NEIS|nr:hypothetical protein [Paralysiella testudinis]QRQ82345.1 hypothetical protein JQU52_02750 [Paralysiella testudinis]